ncbi:MAG: hypothetical protein ACXV7J_07645 [Methylomonas sp.]
MRKIFLLALWLLTFQHSISYAGDVEKPSVPPEFIKVSISDNLQESHNSHDINTVDDWFTASPIYSLIAGIYALYWIKQKA